MSPVVEIDEWPRSFCGPLAFLGGIFDGWDGKADWLVHLQLRAWLLKHAGDEVLLAQIRRASEPPWPQLRLAVMASPCRGLLTSVPISAGC